MCELVATYQAAVTGGYLAVAIRALELLGRRHGMLADRSPVDVGGFEITIRRVEPRVIDGRAVLAYESP